MLRQRIWLLFSVFVFSIIFLGNETRWVVKYEGKNTIRMTQSSYPISSSEFSHQHNKNNSNTNEERFIHQGVSNETRMQEYQNDNSTASLNTFLKGSFSALEKLRNRSSSLTLPILTISNTQKSNNTNMTKKSDITNNPLFLKQDQQQKSNLTKTHNNNNKRNVTLIVRLRGELGNQLSILADARLTQYIAEQKYPQLNVKIIGQHQDHSKWIRGKNDIIKCFPQLHNFNFEGGIWDKDFKQVESIQNSILTKSEQMKLMNAREDGLDLVLSLLDRFDKENITSTTTKYSIPYLTTDSMTWSTFLGNERLYNDLRHWFRFDEMKCCKQIPKSDETVLHYRNFIAELNDNAWGNHFTEITPETASDIVFNTTLTNITTTSSNKIAIVSRSTKGLTPYVKALTTHNNKTVRIITGQTGVQDFCFLMKTNTELIASYRSTYARWASFIGNTTMNRFYKLNQNKTTSITTKYYRVLGSYKQNERIFQFEEYWQPNPYNNNKKSTTTGNYKNTKMVK